MKQLFTQYLCVSGTLLNVGNIDINENKQTNPALRVQGRNANIYTSTVKIQIATKNSLCLGDSEKAWERNASELTFEK